jgi:hypothetical protein
MYETDFSNINSSSVFQVTVMISAKYVVRSNPNYALISVQYRIYGQYL